ncbi:hypothetical protein AB0613_004498 [Vibrio parahaemolyticus]
MKFSLRKNVDHFDTIFNSLLDSIQQDKKLVGYISTFNIDLDEDLDQLLQFFDEVHLVVNTNPLRNRIEKDNSKLEELLRYSNVNLYLNRYNHSKVIAYDDCVYVGSCNFSGASFYNIEAGVISKDPAFISEVIYDFKKVILSESSGIEQVAKNYTNYRLKEVIDFFLPKYDLVIKKINDVNDLKNYIVSADPAGVKLKKLKSVISDIKDIYIEAESRPCFNELNILPNLNVDKTVSSLERVCKKIEQFRADGDTLVKAAEKKGYDLSTMLMSDYQRIFANEEVMDRFLENEDAFDDLSDTLALTSNDMKEQLKSISSYLKTLMWFGNRCRELNT